MRLRMRSSGCKDSGKREERGNLNNRGQFDIRRVTIATGSLGVRIHFCLLSHEEWEHRCVKQSQNWCLHWIPSTNIHIYCFPTTPYLSPRIAETETIFRAEEIHKYGVY